MVQNPKPPKDDDAHQSGRGGKPSRPKNAPRRAPPAGNGLQAGLEAGPGGSRRKKAAAASRAGKQTPREARELLQTRIRDRTAQLEQANRALREEIAERQRAEQAVQAERQRFNDVLETLPAYLILLTPDHRVPFANRFFRERFGESHGRRCFEYLFGRTEPCEVCETYKVLQTLEPLEWEWTGPDGRNYHIYDFPFTDTDGSTLIMETGIDVTERKRAENALKEAKEMLEQRVAERTAALQEANERLRAQAEELRARNEEFNAQAEELAAQAEELQTQTEELRENEQALRKNERVAKNRLAEIEAIYNSVHVGLCVLDRELRFRRINERLAEINGVPAAAHLGRTVREVVPDLAETAEKLATRIFRTGEPVLDIEFSGTTPARPDVLRYWIEHWLPLKEESGEVVGINVVVHEMTERKQMEEHLRRLNDRLEEEVVAQTEELRESIDRLQDEVARRVLAEGKLRRRSQMLEAFFRHTITPLAFLDKYFNFVRVNEAYARANDKTPEFFAGQNYFALFPPDENRALFEQVVRTRQAYQAYAKPCTPLSDPRRVTYWNWQLTPLLNEFGDVQSLVLNLEDVTERQQAFQEIEQRARQLQKLTLELSQAEDRERKRLAEILHDDLQQQLAAAKFHLGMLRARVKDDAPVREMTGQLNVILRDAIEKSRSLSHELSPAVLYQSDLGETFEWLARQVQAQHGLMVHVEVRGRVDPKSEAIRAFLYRAGQEILFNVVKHARTKEAKLRLQNVREQLWLTITDQGQGFDPEALGSSGGFGLLSIRERVELLGGRMKIRSARGKGSAFLIAVPDAATTGPAISAAAGPPAREAAGPKLRVLLVDDHEVVREGLAVLLAEQGDLEVVGQAGNGREAVDLAHQLRPDVVVIDAAMPVMPGDEATRQIKRDLPATRVIGLSMSVGAETAGRMRDAGAQTYLLKTAPSEELLAAIRGAVKE